MDAQGSHRKTVHGVGQQRWERSIGVRFWPNFILAVIKHQSNLERQGFTQLSVPG